MLSSRTMLIIDGGRFTRPGSTGGWPGGASVCRVATELQPTSPSTANRTRTVVFIRAELTKADRDGAGVSYRKNPAVASDIARWVATFSGRRGCTRGAVVAAELRGRVRV